MLQIYFGELVSDKYIFNPDVFFDNTYEDEWMTDELTKAMVKSVDGSEIIGTHLVESPFLGPIPPERLSGGVKTLILMAHDHEHIFNASACGDNCAEWILKIASMRDLVIRLGHIMDFGTETFSIKILNTNAVVHTMAELDIEVLHHHLLGEHA